MIQNVGENGFDVVVGVPFVTTIVGQEGDDESFPGFGGTEKFGWHFGLVVVVGRFEGWDCWVAVRELIVFFGQPPLSPAAQRMVFLYNNKYGFSKSFVNNFRTSLKERPELLYFLIV